MQKKTTTISDLISEQMNKQMGEPSAPVLMTEADNSQTSGVRQVFTDNITLLEGDYEHDDTQDIQTMPYGIAMHQKANKDWHTNALAEYNKGRERPVKQLPKEQYFEKAQELMMAGEDSYRSAVKGYDNLNSKQQFMLLSAKYNTGDTYKTLGKLLVAYNKEPSPDKLPEIYINARRTQKNNSGKASYDQGMDNRALKELYISGMFDPQNKEHRAIVKKSLPLANPKTINSSWPGLEASPAKPKGSMLAGRNARTKARSLI
mgnify:FL=1|tara:strand:+ start:136 stop:918 length:783 start_codon:yes stop_codon:yes gene_type:complete